MNTPAPNVFDLLSWSPPGSFIEEAETWLGQPEGKDLLATIEPIAHSLRTGIIPPDYDEEAAVEISQYETLGLLRANASLLIAVAVRRQIYRGSAGHEFAALAHPKDFDVPPQFLGALLLAHGRIQTTVDPSIAAPHVLAIRNNSPAYPVPSIRFVNPISNLPVRKSPKRQPALPEEQVPAQPPLEAEAVAEDPPPQPTRSIQIATPSTPVVKGKRTPPPQQKRPDTVKGGKASRRLVLAEPAAAAHSVHDFYGRSKDHLIKTWAEEWMSKYKDGQKLFRVITSIAKALRSNVMPEEYAVPFKLEYDFAATPYVLQGHINHVVGILLRQHMLRSSKGSEFVTPTARNTFLLPVNFPNALVLVKGTYKATAPPDSLVKVGLAITPPTKMRSMPTFCLVGKRQVSLSRAGMTY